MHDKRPKFEIRIQPISTFIHTRNKLEVLLHRSIFIHMHVYGLPALKVLRYVMVILPDIVVLAEDHSGLGVTRGSDLS